MTIKQCYTNKVVLLKNQNWNVLPCPQSGEARESQADPIRPSIAVVDGRRRRWSSHTPLVPYLQKTILWSQRWEWHQRKKKRRGGKKSFQLYGFPVASQNEQLTFVAPQHRQKWTSIGDPAGTHRGLRNGKKIGNLVQEQETLIHVTYGAVLTTTKVWPRRSRKQYQLNIFGVAVDGSMPRWTSLYRIASK